MTSSAATTRPPRARSTRSEPWATASATSATSPSRPCRTIAEPTPSRSTAARARRTRAASLGTGPSRSLAFTPPSSLGGDNEDIPDWWNHVVNHLQGFGWPSANTDQLREAALAWESAASTVDGLTCQLDVAVSMLETQRSPEIPTATAVLATTRQDVSDLAKELRTLGSACNDYATQVDETRQTIKDLLHDLAVECAVSAGIGVGLSFFTFGGAGAVAAGVIAVRAVKYARLILAALRGLQAARAVATVRRSIPVIARVKRSLDKLKRARALVATYGRAARGKVLGQEALSPTQLKNLKRYYKKLPGQPGPTTVRDLGNGACSFTTKVPGHVPGSYAEYTKIVDETGETISYVKTVYAPDGRIVHIKDKMTE